MISPLHAQMAVAALGSLTQITANRTGADTNRDQLRHEYALAELRAEAFAHLFDAVIHRRLDLAQEGFLQVLREISTQARHYMDQQDRYAAAELDTFDPLRRIELRKRINDIDVELRQIRADARQLYDRMCSVLLAIGGPRLSIPSAESTTLMLTGPDR